MINKEQFLYWVKYLIGTLHIKKVSLKKPIVIFSSRRSGSTLLSEVIGSEEGMNVSDQPFDLWHYNPYASQIPQPRFGKFIDLTPDDEAKLFVYSDKLFSGKIRVYTRWRLFDPDYHFIVNRMVFKVLSTKFLMDWFDQNFDISIVYQVRHPIPYALSVMKLQWGCTADAFLRSPIFVERYLEGKLKICRDIMRQGTPLQQHVLEWGLENKFPLSVFSERDWLTLSYEELVTKPRQMTNLLADYLDLTEHERLYQRISRPSVSTTQSSKQEIKEQNPDELIQRWMKKVDPVEAKEAMDILDEILGIKVYTWDNPYPVPEVCHFNPVR